MLQYVEVRCAARADSIAVWSTLMLWFQNQPDPEKLSFGNCSTAQWLWSVVSLSQVETVASRLKSAQLGQSTSVVISQRIYCGN